MENKDAATSEVVEPKPAPMLRGAALRAHALGDRTAKWRKEIIEVDGQQYLVRSPSIAAQKKITGCLPDQKVSTKVTGEGTDQEVMGIETADMSFPPGVMLDMKVQRLITCTYDLFGQRIFSEEDVAEIQKWPAEDELLNAVSDAVDRLTKSAVEAGKKSGGTGRA